MSKFKYKCIGIIKSHSWNGHDFVKIYAKGKSKKALKKNIKQITALISTNSYNNTVKWKKPIKYKTIKL